MPLFEVDPVSRVVNALQPTTFPSLNLWERRDLEAWVASAPDLAGGDFIVVTSEYDRFDRTSERLDLLGVVQIEEGHGRLVVVELKRDGSSTTVDLQAIKYAAYVAASQFEDVAEMYARHHDVTNDEALEVLREVLGGDEDARPLIDTTPRIVLLAGGFRPEVTTTVLWLRDNFDVDIRCVRLQPFEIAGRVVVSSEVIIPLPEAEQYRLGVQRKRRELESEQQRTRVANAVPVLQRAGAIAPGTALHLNLPMFGAKDRTAFDELLDRHPEWATLEWTGEITARRAVLFPASKEPVSLGAAYEAMRREAGLNPAPDATRAWVVGDTGKTVRRLADEILERAASPPSGAGEANPPIAGR